MIPKITFLTLYDPSPLGVLLLARLAKNWGAEVNVINLKRFKDFPVLKRKKEFRSYQYHINGLLRASGYALDKISKHEVSILCDKLEEIKPDLLCLSTRSFGYIVAKEFFSILRERLPELTMIGGGWGPTLEPKKFLEICDYIAVGEGEKTIIEICCAISKGEDLSGISNLAYYNEQGELHFNTMASPLTQEEFNELPFPGVDPGNRFLISDNKLIPGSDYVNSKKYELFAARGCPFSCTYCLSGRLVHIYKKYSGENCPKYRIRAIDVVLKELLLAKGNGAKFIRFHDEVFPIHKDWIEEFLSRYPKEIGLPFFAYLRPEFHDSSTITRLVAVGLEWTAVGIQSGAEEIRKIYKRKLAKQKVIDFARTISEEGIRFSYHFIYLNPFEKEHHLKEQLEFIWQLPYSIAYFAQLEPHPGSSIREKIDKEKPVPLPLHLADWYVFLHSMSITSKPLRIVAKFVYNNKLFQKTPFVFSILFIPSIVREFWQIFKNRFRYTGPLYYIRRCLKLGKLY